jgi:3-methyladenine DNA glycosylase AlkD
MPDLATPDLATPDLATILAELAGLPRRTVPELRRLARKAGRDQSLAEQLWDANTPSSRVLASMIGEPAKISRATMDRWAADFDSWWLCDSCSYDLFDRTPHAWPKIRKYAKDEREFVRRAAFAMIAGITIHDKAAPDEVFLEALPLIEAYAYDGRNFVRKGVNWALRNIGKRNPALRLAAMDCARRAHAQGTSSAKWIASDALRELKNRG